ncbi:hypothetical protein W97_06992 [Coniosporium apollinis CBS 100218]|uniref:Tetraspanin Tsp3 n=1 Tax=Coniosporium apollinis (strain CBS 100218) TaxID=1168221 RepID=R7Z0Y0_CONA1|nr:uncharacterized protein W97_06992 [Coniosporium apollinis CBS 100218]EON67738.1 hypothetical protein W97_06992 [Coniosporium apollinis CBS 100218]
MSVSHSSSYAVRNIQHYSLPIPAGLGAFTVALPAIAGLAVVNSMNSSRRRHKLDRNTSQSPRRLQVFLFLLIVYETVIATLAGTHITPASNLRCGLDDKWHSLFHNRDVDRIRRIQDQFRCCGLHSVYDMAWPFQDKTHVKSPCAESFDRQQSCFPAWRAEEQKVAGLLLLVSILVFLWQTAVVASPLPEPSWLDRILRSGRSRQDAESGQGPRRALEYQSNPERYSDSLITEEGGDTPVEVHRPQVTTANSEYITAPPPLVVD